MESNFAFDGAESWEYFSHFMYDMTYSGLTWRIHIRREAFICVTWLSLVCVTWLLQMCAMTHSYVCAMTHLRVWHDFFIRVTWRFFPVWHDSQVRVHTRGGVSLIHMCAITLSHVWHDVWIYVTWLTGAGIHAGGGVAGFDRGARRGAESPVHGSCATGSVCIGLRDHTF